MTIVLQEKINSDKEISNFLSLYGSQSITYHTLQPELSHFSTLNGYIAYQDCYGETIVLGDPIANEENYHKILNEFLRFRPSCSFIQVGQKFADVLVRFEFTVNHFGDESQINLPYHLNGKQQKEIRNLINSAKRNKIQVREIYNRDELQFLDGIKRKYIFNNFYLKNRAKEYAFLARPLVLSHEKDVRIFGGFQNGRLVCYSLFDPMYADDRIIGYAEAISRQTVNSPKGSRSYTLLQAMDQFYKEEKQFVNIGLLPFYPNEKSNDAFTNNRNKFVEHIFRLLYKSSPLVSNFAGLSFHKSRYRGELIPKYFATNSKRPYKTLLSIYKLTSGNWLPFFFRT